MRFGCVRTEFNSRRPDKQNEKFKLEPISQSRRRGVTRARHPRALHPAHPGVVAYFRRSRDARYWDPLTRKFLQATGQIKGLVERKKRGVGYEPRRERKYINGPEYAGSTHAWGACRPGSIPGGPMQQLIPSNPPNGPTN